MKGGENMTELEIQAAILMIQAELEEMEEDEEE